MMYFVFFLIGFLLVHDLLDFLFFRFSILKPFPDNQSYYCWSEIATVIYFLLMLKMKCLILMVAELVIIFYA